MTWLARLVSSPSSSLEVHSSQSCILSGNEQPSHLDGIYCSLGKQCLGRTISAHHPIMEKGLEHSLSLFRLLGCGRVSRSYINLHFMEHSPSGSTRSYHFAAITETDKKKLISMCFWTQLMDVGACWVLFGICFL